MTLMSLKAVGPVELIQIINPQGIYVSDDMLYVPEGTTIYMYNLKNYEYIGKFGKDGEGPGEIRKNPVGAPIMLVLHHGEIYITSMDKLSVFSKLGEFIREHKFSTSDTFYPFAEQFVCRGAHKTLDGKFVLAIFMADKNFNRGQLLYASDVEVGQNSRLELPHMPFYPIYTDDQLFVISESGKDGFAIDVFDQTGKKQYRTERKEPSISVPASYRVETEKALKKQHPLFSAMWTSIKEMLTFKSTYPPIKEYFVDDGWIYVLTYKMKGDDRECIVFDIKGKEIKRMNLPVPEKFGLEFNRLYTIKNTIFYQLKENEENESWKLRTISLK